MGVLSDHGRLMVFFEQLNVIHAYLFYMKNQALLGLYTFHTFNFTFVLVMSHLHYTMVNVLIVIHGKVINVCDFLFSRLVEE